VALCAVTGASGHLGRFAVQQLLACSVLPSDILAVVRSRTTVAEFAARGVLVREADYSEPDTLRAALAGVTRLLLVSSSGAGQRVVHHQCHRCGKSGTGLPNPVHEHAQRGRRQQPVLS
jgi:NAD(P)H dehydrogenase (quinone)